MVTVIAVIAAVVSIIGVLVPIIDELDDNIVSVNNNETLRFMVADGSNIQISYDSETGNYTIGTTIYEPNNQLVAIGDGIIAHMGSGGIQITDNQNSIVGTTDYIDFSKGTYEYSIDGTEYSGGYQQLLYPHEKGTYGCYNTPNGGTIAFNVDKDDTIYITSRGAANFIPRFVLSVTNTAESYLVTPVVIQNGYTEYTGQITINQTYTESEDGLTYRYTEINAGTAEEPRFNTIAYAPLHYSILDSTAQGARDIVGIIPLTLIIGLLIIVAASLMAANRSDI